MKNPRNKKGKVKDDMLWSSQVADKSKLSEDYDPEHKRTKKPGSQSQSANRHNNGRGGGK